jgi:hypothetical protein
MAGIREMTLPRYVELQWQQEVVERWLNSSDTPFDVHSGLLDILSKMKEEIEKEKLEATSRAHNPESDRQSNLIG